MSIVDELRNLDTNDPGRWPLPFRIGAVALVFVAVVAVGVYMFVIKDEVPLLERAQLQEIDLRTQFEHRGVEQVRARPYLRSPRQLITALKNEG